MINNQNRQPAQYNSIPQFAYVGPPTLTNAQLLQVYLVAAIVGNFACLFFNGHGGDLGFWFDWINQLKDRGYKSFSADYPPLFVHWIYATSKIIPALGVAIENNLLLKGILEFPTLLCHIAIVCMVNNLLERINADRIQRHCVLLITALNPAILFNGPVWGQVDLIPVTFALAAPMVHFSPRYCMLSIPFYALAILTKFQMICFAPVMGILFFRKFRCSLIGIMLGLLVIAAAFSPFIINGEFIRYFKQAYINTLGQYAYTTFNAANLWMILTGNTTPDSHVLFTVLEGSRYQTAVNVKHFGMGIFALTSLLIFAQGLCAQYYKKLGSTNEELGQIFFYALFCAVAFFTLLPAMHERYLFPAVVMAIAYTAINPKRIVYTIAITLICFVNMALINGINGSDVWLGLSIIMISTLIFTLIEFFTGKYFYLFLNDVIKTLAGFKWLGFWALLICSYFIFSTLVKHYTKIEVVVAKNQQLLTEIPVASTDQSYGTLRINRSVDDKPLSVGGQRYLNGLGTHTTSNIRYLMPQGAKTFTFIVGVDDEVGTADMRFSVWGDNKKLWESNIYYGYEKTTIENQVDITNVRELHLRVEPVTEMQFDHADWINPIITFDHEVR